MAIKNCNQLNTGVTRAIDAEVDQFRLAVDLNQKRRQLAEPAFNRENQVGLLPSSTICCGRYRSGSITRRLEDGVGCYSLRDILGSKMSLHLLWQGAETVLAVPLVIDRIRLTELAWRRQEVGPPEDSGAF